MRRIALLALSSSSACNKHKKSTEEGERVAEEGKPCYAAALAVAFIRFGSILHTITANTATVGLAVGDFF
jgi:hypothetical protein